MVGGVGFAVGVLAGGDMFEPGAEHFGKVRRSVELNLTQRLSVLR